LESEVHDFSNVIKLGKARKKRIRFTRATSLKITFVWELDQL